MKKKIRKGIHIDPKNEGSFMDFAQSLKMSFHEAADHVLAHKDQFPPERIRQANYAQNTTKLRHEEGKNDVSTYAHGGISIEGYKRDSPDRFNSFNLIPSNIITMKNVPYPVLGIDNTGVTQLMLPGANYRFPGQAVLEVPMGYGHSRMQFGGTTPRQIEARLAAIYGAGWRKKASQKDLQEYNRALFAEQRKKEEEEKLRPYLNARKELDSLQKANDSLLTTGLHPFQVMANRQRAGELTKYLASQQAELAQKELGRARVTGKAMMLAGKYIFPQATPVFNGINNAVDVVELAQNPSDTMNRAQVVSDIFSNWKSPRSKIKPFNRLGDALNAIEIYEEAKQYGEGGGIEFQQGGQARLVSAVPEGYVFSREQQGRKYYTKNQSSGLPMASGTGTGGAEYEQFLISQLNAGVSPEELAQKKYIDPNQAGKYQQYYKPRQDVIYTQPPAPAVIDNPVQGFFGNDLYYPNKHLAAQVKYASRKSIGQADPGTLNTARQTAQMMFLDKMGKIDPSKGYYEIPADIFSNNMVRGTNVLQDTTGLSQYRVPGTYQQGGQARLVSAVPEGYVFSREQQGRKYYTKNQSSGLPMASGTGTGGAEYEQFLISQLNAGVSPEELAQKKYIDPNQAGKYQQYYKPRQDVIYTQPPAPAVVDNPAQGFSGNDLYYPNKHLAAQVKYASRKSTGQADPGTLNTARQTAQMMFLDKMGKIDPSKGYYEIPADIFSNNMVRGTNVLQDTTGLSQYRVPGTYQGGGVYNPLSMSVDPSLLMMGQNPGFQNFMRKKDVLQKDNPVSTDPDAYYPDPDFAAVGQMKGLRDFFHKPKVLAKDSTKLMADDNGAYTPPEKTKTIRTMDPFWGSAGVAGLSFLGNLLEAKDRNRYKDWQRLRGLSDSFATVVPGSRGDYSMNEGYFRPDQYVPTQFGALPTAAEGGDFTESPREVQALDIPEELFQNHFAPMADNYDEPNGASTVSASGPLAGPNLKVSPNQASRKAYDYYVNQKGLSPHIAAGIVGNLYRESGLQTRIEEQGNTREGRGIAQWNVNDRWKGLLNWATKKKRDPYNLYTQLDFVLEEPGESTKAFKALLKTRTPEEASYVFGKTYERPADKYAAWDVRAGIARKLFDETRPVTNRSIAANTENSHTGNELFFQTGGEYNVTPKQLEFILAHGGEVEIL